MDENVVRLLSKYMEQTIGKWTHRLWNQGKTDKNQQRMWIKEETLKSESGKKKWD